MQTLLLFFIYTFTANDNTVMQFTNLSALFLVLGLRSIMAEEPYKVKCGVSGECKRGVASRPS